METNYELELKFNEDLRDQELHFKFLSRNEFQIIGIPVASMRARLLFGTGGVVLVALCLIYSSHYSGAFFSSFSIAGSVVGLIMAGSPFLNFYSKKLFKIQFSNTDQQVTVERGLSHSARTIGFDEISYLQYRKIEMEDVYMESVPVEYKFSLIRKTGKPQELFTISATDRSMDAFVGDFVLFLSQFINKETRALL